MNTHFDPYEELANAIIVQAAKDYKDVLKGCVESNTKNRKELEQFFHSEYFITLTNLDGKVLMERLRQTVHEEEEAKRKRALSRHRKSVVETKTEDITHHKENVFRYKNYIAGEYKVSA